MNPTEIQVRRFAAEYVANKATLAELERWLAPLAWSLDDESDSALRDIVNEIELRIAEYTSGAWDETALRSFIRDIAIPASASRVVNLLPRKTHVSAVRSLSTRTARLEVCV